jgi:hypothetical protein
MIGNRPYRPWLVLIGLLAGVVAAVGVAFLTLIIMFDETSERCYATYAQAKAEESSGVPYAPKGWMPSFFPADTHDICMTMNLDSSQVIVDYRYETAPLAHPGDATAISVPPESEIPFLDESELRYDRITGAYAINSSEGPFTFVVDEQGHSALLWSR